MHMLFDHCKLKFVRYAIIKKARVASLTELVDFLNRAILVLGSHVEHGMITFGFSLFKIRSMVCPYLIRTGS